MEINILSFFLKAVATRNLPLCCVLCKCKILRVKNNYMPANQNGRSSHHSAGLPKSVSGYEVCFVLKTIEELKDKSVYADSDAYSDECSDVNSDGYSDACSDVCSEQCLSKTAKQAK